MNEPLPAHAQRRLLAAAAADTTAPPPVPERYRLGRELGRGGMGVVYEAVDCQLGRPCAIKVIGAVAGAGDELRRRFQREAMAAARLRHPHIAGVHDATADYIAMQLVRGEPIDAIAPERRRHLVTLLRDAARAVQHAHEQGIVHRDLKPSNLLVEGDTVFVVDFGLAKALAVDATASLGGAVLGTPAYMPPEQARGHNDAVDARSDVWSLGATLYRCLCGRPPFTAPDLPSLLHAIVAEAPPPPRLDRDLDTVLGKCLDKDPARRYGSASELADDLQRWLDAVPVTAVPPSLGHRLAKLLQRRRALVRTAALAVAATALAIVPFWLRASAARAAATAAIALSDRAAGSLQDAQMFARLGDLPSAHRALDACIEGARAFLDQHEVPRVRHLLSRLLRARGQPDLALAELDRALAGDAALAEARFERGLLLAALPTPTSAQRDQARSDLATPIRERTVLTELDLLHGRAEHHRLEGDLDRAAAMLQEVLAYEPTHVAARRSLSLVALARGDGELARHYAISAVDLQQGFGPAYLERDRANLPTTLLDLQWPLADLGSPLAAAADNSLWMAQRAIVHLRRALRLRREGEQGEALAAAVAAADDLQGTLALHPDLAAAHANRAVCLLAVEQLATAVGAAVQATDARVRAEQDLVRAIELAPDLAAAHANLGLLSVQLGELAQRAGDAADAAQRFARGRAALQRALALAPPAWPHAAALRARLQACGG